MVHNKGTCQLTLDENRVNVFIDIIRQCHQNEAETNLWPDNVEADVTDSELNVPSLFPCLLSEGQLVMRCSALDRDALLSAGATENLSELK